MVVCVRRLVLRKLKEPAFHVRALELSEGIYLGEMLSEKLNQGKDSDSILANGRGAQGSAPDIEVSLERLV